MPVNPTAIGTVIGLAIAAWFAMLCRRDMVRALLVFAAIGWIPFIRMFELSGSRITQSLVLAQVLPAVMIAVWWLGRLRGGRTPLVWSRFNRPLFLLIPLSLVALLWTLGGHDPAVPAQNVKLAVSLGQVLLVALPVGLYFVSANVIPDTDTMRAIVRLVIVMAVPSVALPFAPPEVFRYISWTLYFALVASPICLAMSFERRPPIQKLGLLVLALSPVLHGLVIGKAFIYASASISLVVVLILKARRRLLVTSLLAAAVYLLLVAVSGNWIPGPMQDLIDIERQQQSWGGRAGRLALAADTIEIWSRHPIFGVGPGNSWPYMHRYSVIDTPHNQYLNILLELGIVGLGCFLWFIAGAVRTGIEGLGTLRDGFHRTLVVGWLGFFSGLAASALTGDFIIHSIRNDGLQMFRGYYLQWIFLGMVVRAIDIERSAE